MIRPVKLYPFNAGKSYLLSRGCKADDVDVTFESYAKKCKTNPISTNSASNELPFIVCAGVGNGDVFVDKCSTRFFFVLEAKADANIVSGLSTDACKALIRGDALPEQCYSSISVKNGDYITVPKNTPFSIGKDISYVEVYSIKNELHIIDTDDDLKALCVPEKAAPMLKKPAFHNEHDGFSVKLMCTCESFTAAQISIVGEYRNSVAGSFKFLFCLDGGAEMKTFDDKIKLKAGDCYFLPAGMGDFSISGGIEMLIFNK